MIRIVDGPIAAVAGVRPDEVSYPPGAEALPGVWLEARGMLRSVLETTTFADLRRALAGAGRQGDRRAPRTPAPARTRRRTAEGAGKVSANAPAERSRSI